VNKQVNEFGKLAFGSKMRSMEAQGGNSFDPKVTELISACQATLDQLQTDREDAIDDFMDEHAERKSQALAKVLRNFKIKSAPARKAENNELVQEMEKKRDQDTKQVKADYAKINTEEKNKIKERFNDQAK
jgi:hypothetical protein